MSLVIHSVDDRKFALVTLDLDELTIDQEDTTIFLTILSRDISTVRQKGKIFLNMAVDCTKTKTGLIRQAAERYSIKMEES